MAERQVLVVEDDPAIRRGIVDLLLHEGYGVIEAAGGEDGLRCALSCEIDLLLLDLALPGLDGMEILAEVRRARPGLPVIILTARSSEDDRVSGLRGGADDYVVKPFSAREILARVEAVLRRSAERPRSITSISSRDGRTIELERREVAFPDGRRVALSDREVEILEYLASNRGRPVSRRELLEKVWGIDAERLKTRAIDMHVARLREKLDESSHDFEILVTVRGVGYMIGEEA